MDSPDGNTLAAELKTEDELQQSLLDIRSALKAVELGELSARVPINFSEREPMTALATAVNAVIERMTQVRDETALYQHDLEEQLITIEKQRNAIRELSTPMIEVQAGVLCVPIVGIIDSVRASEMTNALLSTIVEKKVMFAVIDITGIEVMDTRAIDHFLRMARSVRLLGAECVLSGINPAIAQSIVHMGIELTGIQSYRSLRDALQHFVQRRQRAKLTRPEARDSAAKTGTGNGQEKP